MRPIPQIGPRRMDGWTGSFRTIAQWCRVSEGVRAIPRTPGSRPAVSSALIGLVDVQQIIARVRAVDATETEDRMPRDVHVKAQFVDKELLDAMTSSDGDDCGTVHQELSSGLKLNHHAGRADPLHLFIADSGLLI
jgi:hypothetical protein